MRGRAGGWIQLRMCFRNVTAITVLQAHTGQLCIFNVTPIPFVPRSCVCVCVRVRARYQMGAGAAANSLWRHRATGPRGPGLVVGQLRHIVLGLPRHFRRG